MLTLWVAPPKMCREFHTQQQLFAVCSLKVCGLFSSEFAKFTFLFKTTSFLLYVSLRGTILVYLDIPFASPFYLPRDLI